MTIRARFIDADGVSFFGEISKHHEVYLRFAPAEHDFCLDTRSGEYLSARREVYRAETWFVPCGPLACPVDFDERGGGYDRVYRFERVDGH